MCTATPTTRDRLAVAKNGKVPPYVSVYLSPKVKGRGKIEIIRPKRKGGYLPVTCYNQEEVRCN
jgi:hypothetical protein